MEQVKDSKHNAYYSETLQSWQGRRRFSDHVQIEEEKGWTSCFVSKIKGAKSGINLLNLIDHINGVARIVNKVCILHYKNTVNYANTLIPNNFE